MMETIGEKSVRQMVGEAALMGEEEEEYKE